MYPGYWAKLAPDKPALIMAGSGACVTYEELDRRSNQLARCLRDHGVTVGDRIAVLMENNPRFLEVVWAALRSGLYITPINRHLTVDEAAYILNDCGARALIASSKVADVAMGVRASGGRCQFWLMLGDVVPPYLDYEETILAYSESALEHEPLGEFFPYSSGTTGRPKGIVRPLSGALASTGVRGTDLFASLFGFSEHTVYLSPAPLYHAAPLGACTITQSLGGTAIVMEDFDPHDALGALDRYRVTHSQWVPTMFSRMLKLPVDQRQEFDLTAHQVAIHAAAPCAPSVKRAMMDWWGPILHEYYAGSEGNGLTYASPTDWLTHPGTVGKPIFGELHICDDDGDVPIGETGMVYFGSPAMPFQYHKDLEQTKSVEHPRHRGWSTLGDVGHLDSDGFLYLTDRANFMIVSGGVNIYPQEIENVLAMHPDVADAAVFGVPNADFGEEVKAIVQLEDGVSPDPSVEAELVAYTRKQLAHYKCPRTVDFVDRLPRSPTGKLHKAALRDEYWRDHDTRVV